MIKEFLANQLKKPSGLLGNLVSKVMVKTNNQAYTTLIQQLDRQPNEVIYEIGYGPGEGIKMLQDSGLACTIHGIDFSENMYKVASKRFKKSIDKGSVQLTHGDFLECEVEDEQYHKVIAVNVIYFWQDLSLPFYKIYDMLHEGGIFCLFMRDVDYLEKKKLLDSGVFQKYDIDIVEGFLKAEGFQKITYTHDKEGYFIQAQK